MTKRSTPAEAMCDAAVRRRSCGANPLSSKCVLLALPRSSQRQSESRPGALAGRRAVMGKRTGQHVGVYDRHSYDDEKPACA